MTAKGDTKTDVVDPQVWESRKKGNVRLAWAFAGVAVVIFLISLWKYRPL